MIIDNSPDWWMPKAWPLFWRRVFFVTLPISGPLWFLFVSVSHVIVGILIIAIGLPFIAFCELKEQLWDDTP